MEKSHSLSYYWKDTRLKVYIWQPFEARIIETWRPNSETPGLQFKYRVPTGVEVLSQLKTFDLFQKSETLDIFNLYTPQLAVKVRGCTYCYWDEKFRNQQWKCELWPHSRWTTWICLPTSCGCCQGDLGEDGLDLHFFWHAGDHHWNPILFPLFSVVSHSLKILGPAYENIPPNWLIQSYSPD